MSTDILKLRDRIKDELEAIEHTVQLALEAWEGASHFVDQQAHFLNSLALNLHSFYNGLERIFKAIAGQIDPNFPSGKHWHRHLLEQMGEEIPNVRPAVLSANSVESLEVFLAFRHRVRNLYTFKLEADLLHELLERLPDAWQTVRIDIETFCDLLKQAGKQKE